MRLEFTTGWTITINICAWPLIHFGLGWLFTRMPRRWFMTDSLPAPSLEWKLYRRCRRVLSLKRLLPDAAPWMGGYAKKSLHHSARAHLQIFIAETRRSESAHWAMLLAAMPFFLWNPPWADLVISAYALTANLPCIIVQRYNRHRLSNTIARHRRE